MAQPQAQIIDDNLGAIIREDEIVAGVLGRKYLAKWNGSTNIRHGIIVLTDKSLHHVGTSFVLDKEGVCKRNRGRHEIPVTDVTDIRAVDIPVPRWVNATGWGMASIGFTLVVAGVIDGTTFGYFFGTFVGSVWVMTPGALLLFSARKNGKKFLDVIHKGGTFALSRQWYPQEELDAFNERCTAQFSKQQKAPKSLI